VPCVQYTTATCKINGNFQRFSTADLTQLTTETPSERFPFILQVAVTVPRDQCMSDGLCRYIHTSILQSVVSDLLPHRPHRPHRPDDACVLANWSSGFMVTHIPWTEPRNSSSSSGHGACICSRLQTHKLSRHVIDINDGSEVKEQSRRIDRIDSIDRQPSLSLSQHQHSPIRHEWMCMLHPACGLCGLCGSSIQIIIESLQPWHRR
jgi:hypothetical protein